MVLLSASDYISSILDYKVARYAFLTIPRPDNPETHSIKGFTDYYDGSYHRSSISGTRGNARTSGNVSLLSEIKKDLEDFFNTLVNFGTGCKSRFKNAIKSREHIDKQASSAPRVETSFIEQLSDDEMDTDQIRVPTGNTSLQPGTAEEASGRPSGAIPATTSNSSTTTPSLQSFESDDEGPITSEPTNNTVQITTRTGSTDTLHMNVEVNASVPGVPVYTSSFSASPRSVVETVVTKVVKGVAIPYATKLRTNLDQIRATELPT